METKDKTATAVFIVEERRSMQAFSDPDGNGADDTREISAVFSSYEDAKAFKEEMELQNLKDYGRPEDAETDQYGYSQYEGSYYEISGPWEIH